MKFTVDKEELASAMSLAGRSVSSSASNTALGGILVELSDGLLTFSATDGNRSIKVPVHLASPPEGEGRILVPGKVFPEVARLLGSGPVQVEYRSTEKDVEVRSGSSSFHIRTLESSDFPPLPEVQGDPVEMPREALIETTDLVTRAASNDDIRPVLRAVKVIAEGNRLSMVATDSYRLAVKDSVLDREVANGFDRNIPAESLRELSRIMGGSEAETVKLTVGDREVIFDVDGTVLSTTTIDGKFPKYEQLFPETWDHDIRLSRSELLESIRRVSQMARKNRPLKVTVGPGEVMISAETPEIGDAEERIPAAFEGEGFSIGFNPDYLKEGVEAVQGEEILLRLISPLRPGLLQPVEGEEFRYLLMPIRLGD